MKKTLGLILGIGVLVALFYVVKNTESVATTTKQTETTTVTAAEVIQATTATPADTAATMPMMCPMMNNGAMQHNDMTNNDATTSVKQ